MNIYIYVKLTKVCLRKSVYSHTCSFRLGQALLTSEDACPLNPVRSHRILHDDNFELPLQVYRTLTLVRKHVDGSFHFHLHLLAHINPMLNPILYVSCNRGYKTAVRSMFGKAFTCFAEPVRRVSTSNSICMCKYLHPLLTQWAVCVLLHLIQAPSICNALQNVTPTLTPKILPLL